MQNEVYIVSVVFSCRISNQCRLYVLRNTWSSASGDDRLMSMPSPCARGTKFIFLIESKSRPIFGAITSGMSAYVKNAKRFVSWSLSNSAVLPDRGNPIQIYVCYVLNRSPVSECQFFEYENGFFYLLVARKSS